MLAVYTFVFSQVFQAHWGTPEQSGSLTFAINLFAGLIAFNQFAEVATKSPGLMIRNTNLITKVIFPIEILPAATVATALFHAVTSLVVLAGFQVANGFFTPHGHGIPPTIALLPLIWTPLISGCLALGWLLSALGVYLRDLEQVVGVATNLLIFLSAVFYPLSSLPERWQPIASLNPLALVIEQTRRVAVNGLLPEVAYLVAGNAIGVLACEVGFRCFQKARRGFADVV